jgi:hypothetical protein
MSFAYLLDIIIVVLLATTIIWCVILNRRLKGLRTNQSELATLIAELNLATSRAESGIAELKSNADQAGATLKSSIEQAERLNDDLAYLSERGSRLVEQLDGPTKRARQAAFAGHGRNDIGGIEPRESRDARERRREARAEAGGAEIHTGIRGDLADLLGIEDPADIAEWRGDSEAGDEAAGPAAGETLSRRSFGNNLLNALKTAR